MKKKSVFYSRFVSTSMIGILTVTLVFMMFSALYISHLGLNIAVNAQEEQCQQAAKDMGHMVSGMEDIASILLLESDLLNCFHDLRNDKSNENYFETHLLQSIDIATILTSSNISRPPLWRISLYNNRGDFIYSGALCEADQVRSTLGASNITRKMSTLAKNPREKALGYLAADPWSTVTGERDFLVLYSPLMNVYSYYSFGVIELMQDTDLLRAVFVQYNLAQAQFCVYDSDGNQVLTYGNASRQKDLVTSQAMLENYDWTITLSQPRSVLIRPYYAIIFFVFIGSAILAALACFLIYLTFKRLSYPLIDLKNTVSSITSTSFSTAPVVEDSIDEISELNTAFSEMLARLNNAMVLEKRATLLALQSQMDPHFLYNMLAVIAAAGDEGNPAQVGHLCRLLSSMLRYSSAFESTLVTMQEEVTYLNSYLELMKARYEDFFSYDVEIDEALLGVHVPKLILQPLAENCFRHGFLNSEPPYYIKVTGRLNQGHYILSVADNGGGFTREQYNFVMERVQRLEKSYSENLNASSIGGLGLASTILRLRLSSGSPIEFSIRENQPKGAIVSIEGDIGYDTNSDR